MKGNDIKLELHKLGELPDGWSPRKKGEELEEALEELEASDREILNKYKPAGMAEAIRARAGKQDEGDLKKDDRVLISRRFAGRMLIPAAAAAVLLLAVLLPLVRQLPGTGEQELTRIKGAVERELTIYRASGDQTEILEDGSVAEEYDLLQLSYRTVRPEYGVILSVDGRGIVTRHYPEKGTEAALLETGGEQYLPFSYELDDAPDFETFYLITSDKPFRADELMDITAAAAAEGEPVLNLPELYRKNTSRREGDMEQYAIPIRKDGNDS